MNFKEYLKESDEHKKKYAYVTFTAETNNKLKAYCKENGIVNTLDFEGKKKPFKFHMTVFFSSNRIKYENKRTKISISPIVPKLIKNLGDSDAVIFTEKNKDIEKIHNNLKKEGLKYTYNSLLQHVSLTYNPGQRHDFDIPKFKLIAEYFIVEDQ